MFLVCFFHICFLRDYAAIYECTLLQAQYGDKHSQLNVEKKMPKRVKKRRKVQTEDGVCYHLFLLFTK